MNNTNANESILMVEKLMTLSNVDLEDELQNQIFAAYIFGMLNGKAHQVGLLPTDVQALMIRIAMEKLSYNSITATSLVQFLIEATDREFHPTVHSIIQRGIASYFSYLEGKYKEIAEDMKEILEIINGE